MTQALAQYDEDIFTVEISDDALEAAAIPINGAAYSFPAAPTVSILVVCCGDQIGGQFRESGVTDSRG